MNGTPARVDVNVDNANSCNRWFCCFGCHCNEEVQKSSPKSISITETQEKTTTVYHKHVHSKTNTPETSTRKLNVTS